MTGRHPNLGRGPGGPARARFTIEVKTHPAHPDWTASAPALADATVAVIDAAGATDRVTVEAFDWRVQRHIRRHVLTFELAWLTRAETVRDAALWWDRASAHRSLPWSRPRAGQSGHPITPA